MCETILDTFDDARSAAILMARLEVAMLAELGFGLDLDRCAATGTRDDLVYVSPRTGRRSVPPLEETMLIACFRCRAFSWQIRCARHSTRSPQRSN